MRDLRRLHFKIRVVVTREMDAETVRLLLDRAMRTGEVPPGIEIHGIDWEKGRAAGTVRSRQVRQALRTFYRVIQGGARSRFELVDDPTPRRARTRPEPRERIRRDQQGRYRDSKGRFVSKERYRASRQRFTREQEHLLDEMRQRVREQRVSAGAEFELTATTKGGTPKRRR